MFSLAVIRLTRPYFDEAEREAVARVLASGMLVQGPRVAEFEARVAERLGGTEADPVFAVAVTNGTTALELALATVGPAGVGPGDEVILGALTWPSPGNAVLLRGATPVLVDIDPTTWNAPPHAVSRALNPRTRAVVAIDQFGVPAEIPALRAVCSDVALVEDAACALGSSLGGVPCGLLGDLGTFSFHPRKVITTGEGGMLTTRDGALATRLRTLRNHGQRSPGDFEGFGPNARMCEMQGALGVSQMVKLDDILSRRRALADELRAAVALGWQGAPEGAVVNHQTAGFVLPPPEAGRRQSDRVGARDALVAALRAEGVEAGALSYALHRLPAFVQAKGPVRLPVAEAVVDGGVAVPLHPGMTGGDLAVVIDALRRHAGWALGRGSALPEGGR